MDRHKKVETIKEWELDTDWWEHIKIGARYADNRQEILETLAQNQQIRIGGFGCADRANLPIKRTSPDKNSWALGLTAMERKQAKTRRRTQQNALH